MKYHRLYIDTHGSPEVFDQVTALLQLQPTLRKNETPEAQSKLWMYCVDTDEEEDYFDFINVFLDHLDPHLEELQRMGITKSDITFWLIYEYNQQCAMEFSPLEMKRLGESGITLCIDCFQDDNTE